MSQTELSVTSWADWSFPITAGTPKHGPTLDKPQTKVWFALGSWWALLVRPEGNSQPELAIFEFCGGEEPWRDAGTVVATAPLTTADACFDGVDLWVATRAPKIGIALSRLTPDPTTRSWHIDDRGPWRAKGIETPSVSVARGTDGSIWLTFCHDALPWYVTGPAERFPGLGEPRVVPGASATLIDVDLSALVALDGGMGLMWSDQGSEIFHFILATSDGLFQSEVAAAGDLVADDHIAIRELDGRLYVAAKTSKDRPGRNDEDPLILLLVREPDGRWHEHPVVNITEPVTRPIPLLEPANNRIHLFYTYGPNPGTRAIHMKSADLRTLEFAGGPGTPVIAAPGAEINDVTGSRDPLAADRGVLLLASDGANRRYYSCLLRSR